jgi:hypothetical protein
MLVAGLASHRFATPRERGSIFFDASKRLWSGWSNRWMDCRKLQHTIHGY